MRDNLGVDKKIKVLRIIARLNIGGPAMQAIYLNKAFNSGSFESKLIYGSSDKFEGDMKKLVDCGRSQFIYIKELARRVDLVNDFLSFLKILFICFRERPHIVHTHTAKAGAIGRFAAILSGVPIKVHTFHGHVFEGYFNRREASVFKTIETILAKFTDKVIILSPLLQKEIGQKLKIDDQSKFSLIPLGIDQEQFLLADSLRGQLKQELKLPKETKLVGIVGRLVPIKNHKMFIDAAKLILKNNRSGTDIKFVIVGDGEMRESISAYAKASDISKDIIFTGWRKDLDRIYADLDIVSSCSINEGTPVSLIEAMLAAKPVIATDVGGVRDLISHMVTGYLVRNGDIEEFAGRVSEVLSADDKAMRIGQAARERARSIYAKERLAKDIELLYRDLLREKGLIR